jgi:pimeloyl-ACP methyl ester carboxylesterase
MYIGWTLLMYRGISWLGAWIWLVLGSFWCLFGFMNMIAFAASPNEAVASVLSILFWMMPGILIAIQSNILRRDPIISTRAFCNKAGCCRCHCFILALVTPIFVFAVACTVAIWLQALCSAADYGKFKPLGSIYTLSVTTSSTTYSIQMHLACFGPKYSSNTTWLFEHGGGSNSNSLKYIATQLAANNYRACVYDRLGYGWTPSLLTKDNRDSSQYPKDENLLVQLLQTAGERGPYVCVGHSAGAEKCLRFAAFASDNPYPVRGIAYLDGYPDFVRAGTIEPSVFTPNYALIGVLKLLAFLAGPTGFTRGLVGETRPTFVPREAAAANTALYAQSRFWTSQLWDVVADTGSGVEGYAYRLLNGSQNSVNGVVTFGKTLNLTIGVYPASSTVSPLDCTRSPNDYCCNSGRDTDTCIVAAKNKELYMQQSLIYANSTTAQAGIHIVAPAGSEHDFPYVSQYADWVVSTLLANFTV